MTKPTPRQAALRAAAASTTDECVILLNSHGERLTVKFRGHPMTAARAVWCIVHGDPGEAYVLHNCNGGSGSNGCANPRHLYLGTPSDNSWDEILSGQRPQAKVTIEQVREIRASEDPTLVLCARYGISKWAMNAIRSRRSWRHID